MTTPLPVEHNAPDTDVGELFGLVPLRLAVWARHQHLPTLGSR